MSETKENVCGKCAGTGQVTARTMHGNFLTDCGKCNGEKVITSDLLKRQELGRQIREKRVAFRILTHEICERYKCTIGEWSDAEWGRLPLHAAEKMMEFLSSSTSHLMVKTEYAVVAKTGGGQCGGLRSTDIAVFSSGDAAAAELKKHQGKMHNGQMAIYTTEIRTSVVESDI